MTQPYSEYHRDLQQGFAQVLAEQLKIKDLDTVQRCMALAKVNITMGAPDQNDHEFRIERDEQAKVLTILIREYL